MLFFKWKTVKYSVWPSEMGTVLALFWCSSTDIMWQCYFVLPTSSGIFSSHFHWHKSLLYVIQFKLLNQKFCGPVSLAKRCWRECNIQLLCGYLEKDTNCHVMVLPWNSTMKCISVLCDSLWNFHVVLFCVDHSLSFGPDVAQLNAIIISFNADAYKMSFSAATFYLTFCMFYDRALFSKAVPTSPGGFMDCYVL